MNLINVIITRFFGPLASLLMYFQLGRVQTYTDFSVWRNNYGILATSVNPVMARGTTTTGLNSALPKL